MSARENKRETDEIDDSIYVKGNEESFVNRRERKVVIRFYMHSDKTNDLFPHICYCKSRYSKRAEIALNSHAQE